MSIVTDFEIARLISCPKIVTQAPSKQMKLNGAFLRNDAKMVASDGTKGTFSMFARKSLDFPENFSIGLTYRPNDGTSEMTLLRCNGKHGVYNSGTGADPSHPHYDFHIHRASESAILAGYAPEKFADRTPEFASFEEALQFYVKVIRLDPSEALKFFPPLTQTDLFST